MISNNQQAHRIKLLANELPDRLDFLDRAYDVLISGKLSMYQVDCLKRIYEQLERSTRK